MRALSASSIKPLCINSFSGCRAERAQPIAGGGVEPAVAARLGGGAAPVAAGGRAQRRAARAGRPARRRRRGRLAGGDDVGAPAARRARQLACAPPPHGLHRGRGAGQAPFLSWFWADRRVGRRVGGHVCQHSMAPPRRRCGPNLLWCHQEGSELESTRKNAAWASPRARCCPTSLSCHIVGVMIRVRGHMHGVAPG